ncbi:MAG: hypothetical protein M0Z90_03680 [Desulfobacteraceae bacterium]|nr:hypothetical protein [Desulfobacteraceae bacterium]
MRNAFRPSVIEFFKFFLWDKPIKGIKESPWKIRHRDHIELQRKHYLEALAHMKFEGDEIADDCKLDSSNKYKHFKPLAKDAHNLKKILADVDAIYLKSFFSKNGTLPDIYWWWRGAKAEAQSAVGGLACLNEQVILINFRFNTPEVSADALELLVYHELLHFALFHAGVPFGHTRAFHALEARYTGFKKAHKEKSDFYHSHVIGDQIGKRRPPRPLKELRRGDRGGYHSKKLQDILQKMI